MSFRLQIIRDQPEQNPEQVRDKAIYLQLGLNVSY